MFDAEVLKNPGAHVLHSAGAAAVACTYWPCGHTSGEAAIHESFLVLALDVVSLKNPGAHDSHLGSPMAVTLMYLPGGHVAFWTAVQKSVLVLLRDVLALKNPNAHVAHIGWVVLEPGIMVYLPGGHLVCAAQPRLGHPISFVVVCIMAIHKFSESPSK